MESLKKYGHVRSKDPIHGAIVGGEKKPQSPHPKKHKDVQASVLNGHAAPHLNGKTVNGSKLNGKHALDIAAPVIAVETRKPRRAQQKKSRVRGKASDAPKAVEHA